MVKITKEQMLLALEEGQTVWQCMERFGCCRNTVCNAMRRYGMTTPRFFFKKPHSKMGRPPGFQHTEEHLRFMSRRMTGTGNPFYGKKHTIETRRKMSENHANISGDANPFRKSMAIPGKREEHKKRCKAIWNNRDAEYREAFGSKRRTGYGEITGTLWARIRGNAKTREISFAITVAEAWDLFLAQKRRCALSGRILIFSPHRSCIDPVVQTASLDRIDSSCGYVSGNLQWVHKDVNLAKRKLTNEAFVQLCEEVVRHHDK